MLAQDAPEFITANCTCSVCPNKGRRFLLSLVFSTLCSMVHLPSVELRVGEEIIVNSYFDQYCHEVGGGGGKMEEIFLPTDERQRKNLWFLW